MLGSLIGATRLHEMEEGDFIIGPWIIMEAQGRKMTGRLEAPQALFCGEAEREMKDDWGAN